MPSNEENQDFTVTDIVQVSHLLPFWRIFSLHSTGQAVYERPSGPHTPLVGILPSP